MIMTVKGLLANRADAQLYGDHHRLFCCAFALWYMASFMGSDAPSESPKAKKKTETQVQCLQIEGPMLPPSAKDVTPKKISPKKETKKTSVLVSQCVLGEQNDGDESEGEAKAEEEEGEVVSERA